MPRCRVGVRAVAIEYIRVAGAGTIADSIKSGLIAGAATHISNGGCYVTPEADSVVTNGAHTEVVLRVVVQTGDNSPGLGGFGIGCHGGEVVTERCFNIEVLARASPREVDTAVGHAVSHKSRGPAAGRQAVDNHAVEVHIVIGARAGSISRLKGYVSALTLIVLQRDKDAVDRANRLIREVNSLHCVEGCDIGRVGHHTNQQDGLVGRGRGAFYGEAKHQVVDRSLKQRHGCIACDGRGAIEVKASATGDCSRRVRIRIPRGAAAYTFLPAGADSRRTSGTVGIKVLDIGHVVPCNGSTGGAEGAGVGGQ